MGENMPNRCDCPPLTSVSPWNMPPLEAPFHPVSLRDAFLVPFHAYWPPRFTKPLESSPINDSLSLLNWRLVNIVSLTKDPTHPTLPCSCSCISLKCVPLSFEPALLGPRWFLFPTHLLLPWASLSCLVPVSQRSKLHLLSSLRTALSHWIKTTPMDSAAICTFLQEAAPLTMLLGVTEHPVQVQYSQYPIVISHKPDFLVAPSSPWRIFTLLIN